MGPSLNGKDAWNQDMWETSHQPPDKGSNKWGQRFDLKTGKRRENANGGHLRGEMLQCYKNVTKKRSLSAGAQVKVGQRWKTGLIGGLERGEDLNQYCLKSCFVERWEEEVEKNEQSALLGDPGDPGDFWWPRWLRWSRWPASAKEDLKEAGETGQSNTDIMLSSHAHLPCCVYCCDPWCH